VQKIASGEIDMTEDEFPAGFSMGTLKAMLQEQRK
jgi:hypothetical protein